VSGVRVSVRCPHCSVPIELPPQDVATGGHVALSTEPLFDHVAEQHGAPILGLPLGVTATLVPGSEARHDAAVIVEQRELPDSRTATDAR